MSLATRCPACGTVFRVVSDQLKVSEGWVRCGRCTDVFNAAQRLFELEADAVPAPPPADRPAAAVLRLPVREPAVGSPALARVNSAVAPQAPPPASEPETNSVVEPTNKAMASAEIEVEATAEPPAQVSTWDDPADLAPPAATPTTDAAPAEAAPIATPEFVRRADRAARWRHPARRGALAGVALLLLALLGAQVALHYRDHVAAAWPGTQPALQAACSLLGCRVEAPRRIEALNVDSSGLVRLQDNSPLYQMSLVVQNKAPTRVRMPAIDLALTDGQGQTTVRRVLSAAELGQTADSLPPLGEVTLQATLDLGERRVAGYTVELFYP
jgi:predicted Zn finger-like uncharacterized protein